MNDSIVIDKNARRRLSEALRHLATGQTTNYKFEDRIGDKEMLRCKDRAIWAIRHQAWFLYSDTKEYRLRGKCTVSEKDRKVIARIQLFLRTRLEYEWPTHPGETIWGMIANVLTLGLIGRLFWNRRWQRSGKYSIWPFIREKDFRNAKRI